MNSPSKIKCLKVGFKKVSTDQLTNYRPTSLLPSLSKVFERIICNRLLSFFISMNTIASTQYGFRHDRSTNHAMLDLITTCFDNLNCSDVVLEYSTRTRVPFFEYSYSYSEPQVLGWYSYSKVNVLGQKKSRVHEYIWPSLKVINNRNI